MVYYYCDLAIFFSSFYFFLLTNLVKSELVNLPYFLFSNIKKNLFLMEFSFLPSINFAIFDHFFP